MKSLSSIIVVSLTTITVLLLTAVATRASTSTTALYHLGDADSSLATTKDSFGAADLTQHGTTAYSSDIGTPVQTVSGSPNKISMDTTSGDYRQATPVTTATSDVGFEMWVKPESLSGSPFVFANTDGSGATGQYLEQHGSQWFFAKASVGVVTFGTATVDQWTELAVVLGDNVSGTVQAYVYQNGVLQGGIASGGSNAAAGGFSIGGFVNDSGQFDGLIDEFRVFTFTNFAAFNPSTDLNLTTPEPASLSLLAVGGLLVLRRRR